MKTTPVLLAAALALGALPAFAADHDHGAAAPAAAAAKPAGDASGGCRMMKMKKGGGAMKGGRMSGMHAGMAGRHAAMHGTALEPALPPERVATLGLDGAQREQLASLEKQNRVRQWALLGDLREERLALDAQLATPEPDPATATTRLRAVQDVEAKLFEARLAARRDALALLTPEQRARLVAPPHRHGAAPGDGGAGSAAASHEGHGDEDDDEGESKDEHASHH